MKQYTYIYIYLLHVNKTEYRKILDGSTLFAMETQFVTDEYYLPETVHTIYCGYIFNPNVQT